MYATCEVSRGAGDDYGAAQRGILGDLRAHAEVAELYGQHTADTGQEFTEEALTRAFEYSQGQPWLVNALAREITQKLDVPPPEEVTAAHVEQARERLIQTRATHLDSLVDKLSEPRVRRIIEPLVAGTFPEVDLIFNNDLAYARDLGLVTRGWPIRVANPIYQEVISRGTG